MGQYQEYVNEREITIVIRVYDQASLNTIKGELIDLIGLNDSSITDVKKEIKKYINDLSNYYTKKTEAEIKNFLKSKSGKNLYNYDIFIEFMETG